MYGISSIIVITYNGPIKMKGVLNHVCFIQSNTTIKVRIVLWCRMGCSHILEYILSWTWNPWAWNVPWGHKLFFFVQVVSYWGIVLCSYSCRFFRDLPRNLVDNILNIKIYTTDNYIDKKYCWVFIEYFFSGVKGTHVVL